jgi:hypothetical protein
MFARTLCVFAVLALASAARADDKLKGEWVVVSIEAGGKKLPEEDVKKLGMSLKFTDDKVISKAGGERPTAFAAKEGEDEVVFFVLKKKE